MYPTQMVPIPVHFEQSSLESDDTFTPQDLNVSFFFLLILLFLFLRFLCLEVGNNRSSFYSVFFPSRIRKQILWIATGIPAWIAQLW